MFKILTPLLLILVGLAGCATASLPEGITPADSIYTSVAQNYSAGMAGNIKWTEVGADRSGYIIPESSPARNDFEQRFPPQDFTGNVDKVFERSYLDKVGQVVAWGVDLDSRTSGFLKWDGKPISVTGRFNFDAASSINTAAIQSAATNMVASVATGFQVTPSVSPVVGGLGVGLIGGLIAGAITANAVESTINGFISAPDFGSRLQHASGMAAHQIHIPRMRATSEFYFDHPAPEIISNGVVRFIFSRVAEKNIDYSSRIFFASTIAIYRGKNYEETFPTTKGWEFITTNLNFIDIKIDERDRLNTLRAIRRELTAKSIKL